MGEKVVINPLTRISGFLEIEVDIENNIIKDARSSGMMFRGFEKMLEGRNPLDSIYFTQRICGICSTAHSMSSAIALENALGVIPDNNDILIRNFIHGCEFLQNHLRHFYQYTFPDFVDLPDINPIHKDSYGDYRLPKELNEKLSNHYLESIKHSREAHKMLAILGGKAPHNHGVFVGGVTVNMNAKIYIEITSILKGIKDFIENIMIDDVYIISNCYKDYFENGIGYGNLMTYGAFNDYPYEDLTYVKPGVLINGNRHEFDVNKITESVHYSWYEGNLEPNVYKKDAYSWVKSPRYEGYAMEVGPLARMYLSNEYTRGISTMDRTIARVLEANKICNILQGLLSEIILKPANQSVYEIPDKAYGVGLVGTTRGDLGHWINIEDKKIKNYTIITPSGWNISPTDNNNVKGVVEKCLIGTFVKDTKNPVEIGRIVRSFDPCVSCATHIISDKHSSISIRVV